MNVSRQSSKFLATAATCCSAAVAVVTTLYLRKRRKRIRIQPNSIRKAGRVSHIRIQSRDAQQSRAFFQALGLQELNSIPTTTTTTVLLTCPNRSGKKHEPYVLIEEEEDEPSSSSSSASDVGIGRLCFGVQNVYDSIEILRGLGYHPVAPPIQDKPGSPDEKGINKESEVVIVAYRDPGSGVMVELVSLVMTLPLKVAIFAAQYVTTLEFPLFVHININATNYERSLQAYTSLGFSHVFKHYGRVVNNLYKALEIADPGIAKQVTMIKTPQDDLFSLDLIEWEDPPSTSTSRNNDPSPKNKRVCLALTLEDVPNQVESLLKEQSGWTLTSPPKLKDYPSPLGKTLVATLQDPDGMMVDVVSYPLEIVNTPLPANPRDKVILITGCDSGFGRNLVCRMAVLGFTVVAACYSQEGANYLKHVATPVVADLGTDAGVQAVVQACHDVLQPTERKLWAVVNNAGVCYPGNVEWQTPDLYQHAMKVNFHAPVAIIHELMGYLKQSAGSRILQVSSVCGMVSQPSNSAYCSTKHALESFSDCLRCEMLPYDVSVCIVQPATMKTPLGLGYWDAWYKRFQSVPLHRQSSFQKDKLGAFIETNSAELANVAEDPNVTVTAMVQALLEPRPPTRLRTGAMADIFFKQMARLPDTWRDAILWKVIKYDTVHAVVEK